MNYRDLFGFQYSRAWILKCLQTARMLCLTNTFSLQLSLTGMTLQHLWSHKYITPYIIFYTSRCNGYKIQSLFFLSPFFFLIANLLKPLVVNSAFTELTWELPREIVTEIKGVGVEGLLQQWQQQACKNSVFPPLGYLKFCSSHGHWFNFFFFPPEEENKTQSHHLDCTPCPTSL